MIPRESQIGACRTQKPVLTARLTRWTDTPDQPPSGRSSGVEHNLAKVGVEGSNPFARSKSSDSNRVMKNMGIFPMFLPV